MQLVTKWLLSVILACVWVNAKASEPLLIITDPWPPYAINSNGVVSGMDVDTVKAVFEHMNIDIAIRLCPWKRCLRMIKEKEADAILDASITKERLQYMFFPEEPVSTGKTVFFTRKDKKIPFSQLSDLNGKRAGAVLGYSYCKELDETPFVMEAKRAKSLSQLFNMLIADRVDFVIDVDAVGFYTASDLGLDKKITTIENAEYCLGGNYLAFSKKEGHAALSTNFSAALKAYKATEAYQAIKNHYMHLSPKR